MYFIPLVMVALALAGGLFFSDQFDQWWFLPFLVSAFVLGLPHGAADWALLKQRVKKGGWLNASRVLTTYLLLILLAGVVTIVFPIPGLLCFLAVSAWHFGSADAYDFTRHFHLAALRHFRMINSVARGLLIIAAPFAFQTETMFAACQKWCAILESEWLPMEWAASFETGSRFVIFYALFAIVGQSLSLLSRGHKKASIISLLEPSLLLALFAATHPLFALGCYFLCWHSLRHLSHLQPLQSNTQESGWLYRLSGPFLIPSLTRLSRFASIWGRDP